MRICGRAVEMDPHYAQAWALLAMAQSSLCYGFGYQVDDGYVAAHTALAIDPALAEAHLPMVKRLEQRRQFDAAAAAMDSAIRLGSESWEVNKEAGRFYLSKRDVETATRYYEKAAELVETDFHGWAMLATCYNAMGEHAKVRKAAAMMVSEAQKAVQQDPSNGAALGILAGGYALLGEHDKTREAIQRALLIDPDNLNMRYNFACILSITLRDAEAALKMLQGAFASGPEQFVTIAETDPDLDPIRDDPRFKAMMAAARKRLGLVSKGAADDGSASAAEAQSGPCE